MCPDRLAQGDAAIVGRYPSVPQGLEACIPQGGNRQLTEPDILETAPRKHHLRLSDTHGNRNDRLRQPQMQRSGQGGHRHAGTQPGKQPLQGGLPVQLPGLVANALSQDKRRPPCLTARGLFE